MNPCCWNATNLVCSRIGKLRCPSRGRPAGTSLTREASEFQRRVRTLAQGGAEVLKPRQPTEQGVGRLLARHGPGDGVITLNVGGKEFMTLRSTVQNNTVLNRRVLEAERNHELTRGGAIFIDRDPQYFHLILQHLRNHADLLQKETKQKHGVMPSALQNAKQLILGKRDVLIRVPKDKDALRDLYVEARYFEIQELESLLCSIDWYTQVASFAGAGSANPFYAASQALTTARRAFLASGGIGIFMGTQNDEMQQTFKDFCSDVVKLVKGES